MVEPRGTGGMIHYAYRMSSGLSGAGAEVTLITSRDHELGDGDPPFRVEALLRPTSRPAGPGAPVAGPLGGLVRRGRRVLRLAGGTVRLATEWIRLTRRLLELRPDVVQFGSIEHAVEGPFLWHLRARGLRLADVVHEPEVRSSRGLRWALDVRLYRGVYRQFAALFLHGEANVARFRELYPSLPAERVHPIAMGSLVVTAPGAEREIDWERRFGIPPPAPVAVFFGTLLPNKGVGDLLDAWAIVTRRRPDARLVVAGRPSRHAREGELRRRAEELGIADVVTVDERYVPNEELGSLMRRALVVVLPYHSATQSGALQVAYAYGRPVVATRVGGLPEVVDEGRSGLVVPPRSPSAIAEALLTLLDDPAAAERMGRHAKELSDTRYSWDRIGESIMTVYRELARR